MYMCKCLHKHAVYMKQRTLYTYALCMVYTYTQFYTHTTPHTHNTHTHILTLCVHKYTMNTNHEPCAITGTGKILQAKKSHTHLYVFYKINLKKENHLIIVNKKQAIELMTQKQWNKTKHTKTKQKQKFTWMRFMTPCAGAEDFFMVFPAPVLSVCKKEKEKKEKNEQPSSPQKKKHTHNNNDTCIQNTRKSKK